MFHVWFTHGVPSPPKQPQSEPEKLTEYVPTNVLAPTKLPVSRYVSLQPPGSVPLLSKLQLSSMLFAQVSALGNTSPTQLPNEPAAQLCRPSTHGPMFFVAAGPVCSPRRASSSSA